MYGVFIDKYAEFFVIDSCLPFKVIKGKAFNSFRKPRLTKGLLRADVCNYHRPRGGKYENFEKPQKDLCRAPRYFINENINFDVI